MKAQTRRVELYYYRYRYGRPPKLRRIRALAIGPRLYVPLNLLSRYTRKLLAESPRAAAIALANDLDRDLNRQQEFFDTERRAAAALREGKPRRP